MKAGFLIQSKFGLAQHLFPKLPIPYRTLLLRTPTPLESLIEMLYLTKK